MTVSRPAVSAFTLVEMLVALAVLGLLMVFTSQIVTVASNILRRTQGDVDAFQESRASFQELTGRLSQAALNPYWSYNNTTTPTLYSRNSDLRFVTGQAATLTGNSQTFTQAVFFQAPLGYSANTTYSQKMLNALNVCGYWIQYGSDSSFRPTFLVTGSPVALRYRYRLMEMCQPTEDFQTYTYTSASASAGSQTAPVWFTTPMTDPASTRVLAENIVALIIMPQSSTYDASSGNSDASIPASYTYDSKNTTDTFTFNQLPPTVQVTMVALDEASALRLQAQSANPNVAPNLGMTGLFQDASKYQTDLDSLEANLTSQHLNYKVFSNLITIPQAKWSQ